MKFFFAAVLGLSWGCIAGAQLPTGVKAVPFYDTTLVTWPSTKPSWMGEGPLPNMEKHFIVFDFRNKTHHDVWLGNVGQTEYVELLFVKPGTRNGWADGGDGQNNSSGLSFSGKCRNPNPDFKNNTYDWSKYDHPLLSLAHEIKKPLFEGIAFNCMPCC